jgi:hypothetical protein
MEVTEIGLLDAAISRRPMLSFLSGEQGNMPQGRVV